MAFTKTPQGSTYTTKKIQLMRDLNSRSSSFDKDIDYVNCFFDVIQNKTTQERNYSVAKRAGTEVFAAVGGEARGLHYWEDEDLLLVAVDNDIKAYLASTSALQWTASNVFSTTTGEVGFTDFLYDDNTVKVVATDGTTLLTLTDAGVAAASADADLPAPHLPQPVFLDGYLFLAKAGSADLYNSDLNDPLAWTTGNFLSSEMFPDTVIRIAKLNNYIVTFGSNSIEYFWDAGNVSGSPLQRNDTPIKLYGYLGGFAQYGNRIYFVGNAATGTPSVYMLEDFKIKEMDDPSLRKFLEVLNVSFSGIFGNIVSFMGHDFYVINVETARTYAMDLKTELWTRWRYQNSVLFSIQNAINIKQDRDYCTVFSKSGASSLLNFDPRVYQDNTVDFTMRIVTDGEMFETYNQKFMSRLSVECDRPASDSTLSISWTDDDYTTYNTAVTVNLNQELPSITRLGRFRRRAFKLEYTDNLPWRGVALEVDINMGQT